jgi:hypothetical protein
MSEEKPRFYFIDAKNDFLEIKLERRLTKEVTLLDLLHYEATGEPLDRSIIPFSKDDEQMLSKIIDQYCKWVDDFLNNSYEKELEKIAIRFYPEGVFTEEGFNEHQIAQSKILLEKSVKYLSMARAIIKRKDQIREIK